MFCAILSDRGLIRLSGNDATSFLQGLVSNDVRALASGHAVYTAFLSPQGKFLHDFFLLPVGDSIVLDCALSSRDELLKRLNFYRLRSKVTIDKIDTMQVAALWGQGSHSRPLSFADPRVAALGWRMLGKATDIGAWCEQHAVVKTTSAVYDKHRLDLAVPDGVHDMIADKSLLLEFGFEDLHGVDFSKGCYVGQEVTARSKYRGQVRKFIYRVEAPEGTLPGAGAQVACGGALVGELRSSHDNIGIALLRVDEVQRAEAGFHCGAIPLKVTLPPWVTHAPEMEK